MRTASTAIALSVSSLFLVNCGGSGKEAPPLSPALTATDLVAPIHRAQPFEGEAEADGFTPLAIDTPPAVEPASAPEPGRAVEPGQSPSAGPASTHAATAAVGSNTVQLPRVLRPDDPLVGTPYTIASFPRSQIVTGGVAKDGIPALTNPPFVAAAQISYLAEDDLVMGVVVNGVAKAYPHNIGWWHEVVNDVIGGAPITASL